LLKIIPSQIKNPNKDYILWNYYIYLSILEILDKKKEETIDENEALVIVTKFFGKLTEKPKLEKNNVTFHISNFFLIMKNHLYLEKLGVVFLILITKF
jgi:hypothetical protein